MKHLLGRLLCWHDFKFIALHPHFSFGENSAIYMCTKFGQVKKVKI